MSSIEPYSTNLSRERNERPKTSDSGPISNIYRIDSATLPTIAAAALPEDLRPLLDHRKKMTMVLEEWNQGKELEIKRFFKPKQTIDKLTRVVLIKDKDSQKVLSVGMIIINIENLEDKPKVLEGVREESIPFGRLLHNHGVNVVGDPKEFYKISSPSQKKQVFSFIEDDDSRKAFSLDDNDIPVYGRKNYLIRTDTGKKIASVYEFLATDVRINTSA